MIIQLGFNASFDEALTMHERTLRGFGREGSMRGRFVRMHGQGDDWMLVPKSIENRPRGTAFQCALGFALLVTLLGWAACSQGQPEQKKTLTVTVGRESSDVIGDDNLAIQQAIDRVAVAGGGTVLIKAGTYAISNALRLASHVNLVGEGKDKTILKKAPALNSRITVDAESTQDQATVEDACGFRPGMGVTLVDKADRGGWCAVVKTIERVEGSTLFFDQILDVDYMLQNSPEVSTAFPLIVASGVEDFRVSDLTAEGSHRETGWNQSCGNAAVYVFHSQKFKIQNIVARNFGSDGISTQFVEDPVIQDCETYGNGGLGIHLGTVALRATVQRNQIHDNGGDGLYLCWHVQHGVFDDNQSWANGQDGISIGFRDTDNSFSKNVVRLNGRAGVNFRNENESNPGSRNTFRENTIEDNGSPGKPGYGVRILGTTQHITLDSNTIRETRGKDRVAERVAIYIGPRTDYVSCQGNTIQGSFSRAVVSESKGTNNVLGQAVATREASAAPHP